MLWRARARVCGEGKEERREERREARREREARWEEGVGRGRAASGRSSRVPQEGVRVAFDITINYLLPRLVGFCYLHATPVHLLRSD